VIFNSQFNFGGGKSPFLQGSGSRRLLSVTPLLEKDIKWSGKIVVEIGRGYPEFTPVDTDDPADG